MGSPQENCEGGEKASRKCPNCYSKRTWKDGLRKVKNGFTQRFVCRECGYRFSESSILSIQSEYNGGRQVCAILTEAKNLTKVEPLRSGFAGATVDVDGEILRHGISLLNNGFKENSVKTRMRKLRRLVGLGADLFVPENVKRIIAEQSWSESTKANMVFIYLKFAKMHGLLFEVPKYHIIQKQPFIPTELELDQLIAGCGVKTATFLQLLKETAMRYGEALALRWEDIDFVTRKISVNFPEKHGMARSLKISEKLVSMIKNLPQTSRKLFGDRDPNTMRTNFTAQRRKIAIKLKNPKLLRVHCHTFRHWRATREYHRTKSMAHVQKFLGHKSILSTQVYVHLVDFESDEYYSRVANTRQEKCALIEAGFDHVATDPDGVMYFRKRK